MKRVSNRPQRGGYRWRISHTSFSIVFTTLLYTICNALNFDKLAQWFLGKGGTDYLALSAYLVAGLCVFLVVFVLFAHRWTVKPLAIFLVIASGAVTYFISKYNVAVDSSMVLNTIHTDATEVGQLLSAQMLPYVLLMAVPIIAILSVDITFVLYGRYLLGSLKVIVFALAIALALLYANYNAIHRAGNVSNKYIVYSLVPINFISGGFSVLSKAVKARLPANRREVEISGTVTSRDNLVVVLAIGESSRRKNFSVYGYQRRNTTPVLQKTAGLHLLNGNARRGSTLYALPEILEKEGIKLTSVTSKLGISTSCLVNYTLYDNCAAVGETKVSQCGHGGTCYDEDVVPLLEQSLKSREAVQQLLVLHLGGGSHGPMYADRYPPEFQRFKPMCNDADIANRCTLDEIYNSYDNTILYLDHVLGEIIGKLDRSGLPYVFIYLSDHGESLMEEGRMFHGMPPGVALPPEQAQIPLIVKSSVPITVDKRAEYSQPEVYDTVLSLLSIETPLFETRGSFISK